VRCIFSMDLMVLYLIQACNICAGVNELDFREAGAEKTIDDWVKDKTNGKIDEIIDAIDPDVIHKTYIKLYEKVAEPAY